MSLESISQTIERAFKAAGLKPATSARPAATVAWRDAMAHTLRRAADTLRGSTAGTAPGTQPGASAAATGPATTERGASQQLLRRSFSNGQGQRSYRLYVPVQHHRDRPAPLILMLHGCKQNPEDFAAGTRMNELADRHGFLVAYPEQTSRENGANCWNWFEQSQQRRDGVEPSVLAGLVADVSLTEGVDTTRVFAAGLSAGAAMALILGATYPEVFAGVASHSGLPVGAASDVATAFAAMRGSSKHRADGVPAVPTFVMHGDADITVACSNGSAVAVQAVAAHDSAGIALTRRQLPPRRCGGRSVEVTAFDDLEGRPRVEQWLVAGGSHTWFGGSASGSYVDTTGPDASEEMVRFFLSLDSGIRPDVS